MSLSLSPPTWSPFCRQGFPGLCTRCTLTKAEGHLKPYTLEWHRFLKTRTLHWPVCVFVFLFFFWFFVFLSKKRAVRISFRGTNARIIFPPPIFPLFFCCGGVVVPADRYTWRGIRGYKRLDLIWKTHLLSQLSPLPFTQERDSKKKKKKKTWKENEKGIVKKASLLRLLPTKTKVIIKIEITSSAMLIQFSCLFFLASRDIRWFWT